MKKSLFFGLFLSLSLFVAAQNGNSDNFQKMVDFLPPAPNAAAIIKHEALSINKNNGSPSFNIPIFSVKGNKLAANISIGYSSTGIKVDEIASRVGMGWALNAGGVVTRTVRGAVDEWNTRIRPSTDPIQSTCGNWNFMNNAFSSMSCMGSGCAGWDSEPDLFNFNMNGHSGSFVYDSSGNVFLIPVEKYKIQKNLGSSAWDFLITDMTGIEYYFGGTGAVEKTKRLSNCGKTYDSYIANTWYLVKIKHPNGEEINFTYLPHNYEYDNGVSQTMHWASPLVDLDAPTGGGVTCPSGDCPPAPSPTKCINKTSTQGVLLHTITCNNDVINFTYETRLDCTDKLVSQIRHYNVTDHIETVNFFYNQQQADLQYINEINTGHTYTPYLTDLQRLSSDLSLANTHRFVYNDPAGRPPRLSFSQDHWGYFNGQKNTQFIPKHADPVLTYRFPNATANREPDPTFASKGMLTKIVYPTGGIDLVTYESNEINDQISGPAKYETYHEYSCNVTGTGYPTPVLQTKSTTFTLSRAQTVEVVITCGTSNPGGYDPIHMKAYLSLSGPITTIDDYFLAGSPAIQYTRQYIHMGTLPAGTYTLTYGAKGRDQTTSVKLKFYTSTTPSNNTNRIVGGVRVKRIMTGNPNEKPTIRRFYYANMENLSQSSMSVTQWPIYNKNYRNTVAGCLLYPNGWNPGPHQSYCDLTAMYSGSLVGLFNYGSGLISYGSVIESIGENFEGGATQTKFNAGPDGRGQVIWGNDILEAPLTNFSSLLNGKVHEEIVYKKPAGNGALFPIKKTQYSYSLEQRQQQILYGYNINKRYTIQIPVPANSCDPATIVNEKIMAFDVVKYMILSYWTHPESVTETIYDENGQNPVTTVNNSFYDNDQHFQLTRSETVNSKNEVLKTINTYPGDHTGPVYTNMVAKNIITPLVTSTAKNNNLEVSFNRINYGDVGNNNFVPVSVEKSVKGTTPPDIEGTIDQYDAKGNILQFTGKNGIITSVIWGYNYKYPVAQVVGATYANAIAQLTVAGDVTSIQSMDGATLRTELHRIRTGIAGASVTTYTYKAMIGVTSITDPNNKTNTYDYDSFNRLMIIKDQDGNVVKKNEYQYVTSSAGSVLGVFFNAPLTKNYYCQTCASGYVDNTVYQYYIPLGKYYSLVDQASADALAAADTEGQEYANKNGKCVNYVTATCVGDQYKVINCICEQGIKSCMGSTAVSGGGWLVNFQYLWSDGSTGTPFTEFLADCTGADKKFLNCICETGLRMCDGVVFNGGGSYTISYHYKWSDNSTSSPPIVETITCSGPDKKMIGCECKTADKVYVNQTFCGTSSANGCCPHSWKCEFYYKWSDNSTSLPTTYFECSATPCMMGSDY